MERCPIHKVDLEFKEGVSKTTGKPYAFWGCSIRDNNGWCKYKPPAETTNAGQFSRSVDELAAREKVNDKDHAIARAVSLKASVDMYAGKPTTPEAVLSTAETFLKWLET